MKSILKNTYHTPVIKKTIINLVSRFHPPPYRRDLMEFEFDIWSGISTIRCQNKRQLGENNTSPAFYRENIKTAYHKSGFEGSRAGYIINMTALHEVMSNWRGALFLIGAMRHCYMERFNIAYQELLPVDLYVLSKICVALPAFLARRLYEPVRDGKISPDVAAAYKITAGIFMVLRKMMENGTCWSRQTDPVSAEAFYEYADRHNIFISVSGHACGGSKRKIAELINFMISGEADEISLSEGVIRLESLVSDIDGFLEYSIQALTLETLIALCRSLVAKTFLDIELKYLQNRSYKRLSENHAEILNRIRKIFHSEIKLDCQIEVLCGILEKLGAGHMVHELKTGVDKGDHEYMEEIVKQMQHLPGGYRISFADAARKYRMVLGFLRERGGMLQNKIFSTLGRSKKVSLSLRDAEKALGILSRRQLEKVIGVNGLNRRFHQARMEDLIQ